LACEYQYGSASLFPLSLFSFVSLPFPLVYFQNEFGANPRHVTKIVVDASFVCHIQSLFFHLCCSPFSCEFSLDIFFSELESQSMPTL